MKTNDYLDAAKQKMTVKSDYELARRFMVRREEISQIRRGIKPMTPYLAARVSDATGIPLEKIITDIEAQDKNEARAAYWKERAARKAAGFFLSVITVGSLSMPTESEASSGETYVVSRGAESRTTTGVSGRPFLTYTYYAMCVA